MQSIRKIAEQCLRDEAQAILDIISQLDEEFERAVELLFKCSGKVVVTGVGKSGHIAAKIAATLSSTGTPAFYVNPLDVFHGSLGVITSDDVAVLISYSGQTDELLRFVPYLHERHIPIVGISGNAESLLARNSTCHLLVHVDHEAYPLNLAPTCSTTATLAIGDAIASALVGIRNFSESDFANFHPGGSLGKRLLCRARDVMRSNDLPVISPNMPLGEAIIHISKGKLGLAVITDTEQTVQGIVTDGDIRRATERLGEQFFHVPVADMMTMHPVCINPDMPIEDILRILGERKIHAVIVEDESHHLLGIVDNFSCYV
ncbi:MAG: KpsF/GutQ family sugar-phosphate isomerase [Bacteroidales bacterium]|nr:KpsF/GutQ family sugar-phosphate isomerase [Candidatus Physcousia equi]